MSIDNIKLVAKIQPLQSIFGFSNDSLNSIIKKNNKRSNKVLKNVLLRPKTISAFSGYEKLSLLNQSVTNVTEKDYSFLLSILGYSSAKKVTNDGDKFLMIGDCDLTLKDGLNLKDGECVVKVTKNTIAVFGKTHQDVSNGIKMLISMQNDAGEFPVGEYRHIPKVDMRAVHFCIFRPDDGTDKERTEVQDIIYRIKKAALCGYNYVLLEFWGMFPYEKHPYAHWKNCYSREDVEKIISFAIDDMHVTPIPVQNLTSHAGWSRISSRQHVVLDQRPDLADMWIPGGWCFATTREDTKAYLRDIIQDLVTTFRNPPFVHCSCDKCFGFGSTEEERVLPADELFINHLKFLHDELKKYGSRMVMWADMLYSSLDVKYWKCAPTVADELPKDILMNIWTHNDIGEREWEDVGFFESRGFETIYSPFLGKDGARNMVKQCIKNKSLGINQTTWHRPETAMKTVVYSGGYMWCGEEPLDQAVNSKLSKEN